MKIEDVGRNTKMLLNGIPFNVDDVDFMKPGKGRAVYRLRLRNLKENTVMEQTYHSGDDVEEVEVSSYEMQYLYQDGKSYVFMNTETFEQYHIPEERLGGREKFLKEGTTAVVQMMGEAPIAVNIANFVELKVVETSASTKTDSLVSQNKPVTLETGTAIGVPAFIKEGDVIKIDTRTGTYVERVTGKK
ncbi:MAG: elongation factor P [Dehalococcoidales bacterium]|nr:elongation factor P [Dehalococcoidales bacterium]